eukprot:gene9897-biopygen1925
MEPALMPPPAQHFAATLLPDCAATGILAATGIAAASFAAT